MQATDQHKQVLEEVFSGTERPGADQLIPVLQQIQEKAGYLSRESINEVGRKMGIPASRIYGVATFYNQFRFVPKGKYHIQVCRGTACHVLGSATVLDWLEKRLGIKAGETDRKGLFSLEVVACIGACGLAPVITVNGEFHARVDDVKLEEIISSYANES
ncbi:MAG: NADH-quinone oxidoreductase subunit NuoE [Bacteroidales bacterium]